jgi:peroxiredoxin
MATGFGGRMRQDGIQVLAINMGESPAAIKGFMERYGIDFPLLMDLDVTAATQWKVTGLPVTFVVDTDGRVVLRVIGEREWDDPAILAQVRALNKARPTIPTATMTLLNHE